MSKAEHRTRMAVVSPARARHVAALGCTRGKPGRSIDSNLSGDAMHRITWTGREMDYRGSCSELRDALDEAVRTEFAEGVLLSGVDTSIVAFHAKKYVPGLKAFTVTRAGFDEDLSYAKEVAEFLRLDHKAYRFASDEAMKVAREAAEILNSCGKLVDASGDLLSPTTFVPTYLALRFAKEHVNSVYCGDGADELFLGYPSFTILDEVMESFGRDDELYDDDFKRAMREYVSTAQFDVAYPIELGKALDLKVVLPYRHPSVAEFAERTPHEFMIREENEKVYGKWILRKAHEEYLGDRVWRKKTPIDFGTGIAELLPALEAQISDIVIRL